MQRYSDGVTKYSDMNSFFNKCSDGYWRRIAQALYYTGCRAGELIQIKQDDISKEGNFIQVRIHTEKNPHAPIRYIPINTLKEPLAESIFCLMFQPNELLFPPYNPMKETSFLRTMRKRFNEYYGGIAPHYFRHCRLTHCVTEFDFNDQELVKYAGWCDSKPAKWYVSLKTTDLQRKMI